MTICQGEHCAEDRLRLLEFIQKLSDLIHSARPVLAHAARHQQSFHEPMDLTPDCYLIGEMLDTQRLYEDAKEFTE